MAGRDAGEYAPAALQMRIVFILTPQWEIPTRAPFVRATAVADRNDPRPCGSGKKYQKCGGDAGYRWFLACLAAQPLKRLPPASEGLDYGSGPGPTLATTPLEAGHEVTLMTELQTDATQFADWHCPRDPTPCGVLRCGMESRI